MDLERVVDTSAAPADLAVGLGEDLVAIGVSRLRVTADGAEALDVNVQWR